MIEWKELEAADFCLSVRDGTHDSPKESSDGKKLITSRHLKGYRLDLENAYLISQRDFDEVNQRSKVDQWDVLISMIGTVGEVYLEREDPDYAIKNMGLFKSKNEASGRWLYYFLQSPEAKAELLARCRGTTQKYVPLGELRKFPVRVPEDTRIRDKIIGLLSTLDDKIELNRRMNETLEEMARALFRDWFVDFGPTRRQMAMKEKGLATNPAAIMGHAFPAEKAATLAPLFPARLGDDGLPEGWKHGSASDHIDFNPKEPLKKGTIAPYSDMASLPTTGALISPPVPRDFKSGMRFRNGDALIARITPCLENGKAGFVDYLTDEAPVGWGSTEFFVLRSKPHVAPQFAYCLVRDPDFKKRAEQSMTGTSGRQRAQIEVLMSHELALPDDSVHAEFEAITTPFFEKIKANGQENQTLAAFRDLLLPKLMSGEIRLKDVEARE
jgi:type I restriction enzyme S subunit